MPERMTKAARMGQDDALAIKRSASRVSRAPMRLVAFRVVAWAVLGIFSAIMLVGGTSLLVSLIGRAFR